MVPRVARSTFSVAFRALALPVVCGGILVGTLLANEGCLTDACKGSYARRDVGLGRRLDDDTWESGPIDGDWIPFTRQMQLELFHPLNRVPYEVLVWISPEQRPLNGSNFTLAGGDVATVYKALPDVVSLTNGTCADFYVRVVLRAPRVPSLDAGSISDAGIDGQ